MDETNQTISVQDNAVVVSTPQPPVEVSYSREVLEWMIVDAQSRIDSNTDDRNKYKEMLDMFPEEVIVPVEPAE